MNLNDKKDIPKYMNLYTDHFLAASMGQSESQMAHLLNTRRINK